jgi:three-Cys-motif partner protein
MAEQQRFGGLWTQKKLECLSKYLTAYSRIFDKNPRAAHFQTTYLDAFAGTGQMPSADIPLLELPEVLEAVENYRKGSVLRALEVQPGFDHYIFIERDGFRYRELKQIAEKFPGRDIKVENANANDYLANWCNTLKKTSRAVIFLDPFGMSVEWTTIELIAKTEAVDLWVLFPLFAVNRMLVRDQKPPESWKQRLTMILGTSDWEEEFYTTEEIASLFEETTTRVAKVADHKKIGEFFVRRLREIFVAAAEPLVLKNSKNSPLYLFCFAAGNKPGATTGLKIAKDIIGK